MIPYILKSPYAIIKSSCDKIDISSVYKYLCLNPHDKAIDILLNNLSYINDKSLISLCSNTNERVVEILSKKISEMNRE